ncbi:Ig-like domain-containing protein [Comamonas sp.]|uniref:Ig-like domain-containing protein n=1 Tax=Comamonas sp. TaxID=34028 RepID=UPI00289F855A|nr:Ig-like domain-containing protein [Comamonas sp.]
MQRHALPAQLGHVLLWGSAAMLASTQASAQQAPILDLNSGPSLISLVEHGDFSQTSTWSSTDKWLHRGLGMACTNPTQNYGDPNAGPHALNAPTYAGWSYGPSDLGGARVSLDVRWTDGGLPSQQNVMTVDLGGTPYATITTSAGAGGSATVTYQNGASGNLSQLPASNSFTNLVLNLPTSVPDESNLAFSYTGEESATTDTLCIDNVVAEAWRDASPGRGNDVRYDEGDAPIAIVGPAATITDADSSSMQGAAVNFVNLQAGDGVWFNNEVITEVSAGVINGLPYAVTAVGGGLTLRLTGPASGAAYITALQTLRFQATASPLVITPRTVNFEVTDGNSISNTAVATVAINAKPAATNNAKTIDKAHSTAVTGSLLSDDDGNGVDADANGDAFALSSFAGLPVTAPVAHTGSYGSWSVNPDGSYSYLLDTNNPAVAALTRTQTLQDSAVYRIAELGTQTLNGSFDNAFVGQGQPGWYAPRNADLRDPADTSSGYAYDASPDGGNIVVLQGNGYDALGSSGVIQQTLSGLVPGSTYTLTFYQTISAHNLPGIGVIPGHIRVTFGGEVQETAVFTPPPVGTTAPWQTISMSFTATATTQLLEMRGVPDAPGGWANTAIDGVNISRTSGTPLFGEATVTMTITGLNSAPTSAPASLSTPQNTPLSQALPAATDVDGDTVTYAPGATAPAHGSVVVQSDGSFVYTPTTGYSGTDSFSFVVSDEFGGSNEYSVAISIAANTNPVDGDEALTTGQGQTLTGNLLANASDAEGDALSISAFTVNGQTYQPGQTASLANTGSLRVDGDGQFSFQPDAQFKGDVPEVGYTVSDARGGTDTSTLRITVTAAPASVQAVPLGGPLWAWLATALLAGLGLRRMRNTR